LINFANGCGLNTVTVSNFQLK